MTLADSTVSGNSAGAGGGIWNGGTTTLGNTIVAGNSNPGATSPDLSGQVTANYCLIQNTTGATFASGSGNNITGQNPKLSPLADNGGPTQTMALLTGSPAVDAGSNALIPSGVTTDQRGAGYPRIVNGMVDIGGYRGSGRLASVRDHGQRRRRCE